MGAGEGLASAPPSNPPLFALPRRSRMGTPPPFPRVGGRQTTHRRLREERPRAGTLLGRARPRAPRQAVRLQAVDPAAVHPRQAQGVGTRSRPPRDAGRGAGRRAGQPQSGQSGRRPEGDTPPLGADVRAGGGEGLRPASYLVERQARRPMGVDASHVRASEDRGEAGGPDHVGRRDGRADARSGARSTRRPSGFESGSGR